MAANRWWRDYRTRSGRRPVKKFLDDLSDPDAAAVAAGMKDVQVNGNRVAHHIGRDIYEVRVAGDRQAFSKKTQKTPDRTIRPATGRLADWRSRGSK